MDGTHEMLEPMQGDIISVSLVAPKRDIFREEIKNLLVLVSLSEITLYTVGPHEILEKSEYTIPTDNIKFLKVVGTKNGRVFMCGSDGELYELDYSRQDTWFRKKARKKNVSSTVFNSWITLPSYLRLYSPQSLQDIILDETNRCLYAVTSQSEIQVYYMGDGGNEMYLSSTYTGLRKSALAAEPELKALPPDSFDILHLEILTRESSTYTLLLIAKCGVRFFFSLVLGGNTRFLVLKHIRFPYTSTSKLGATAPIPMGLVCVGYSQGFFIYTGSAEKPADKVVGISPMLTAEGSFVESVSYLTKLFKGNKPIDIAERPMSQVVDHPLLPAESFVLKNEYALQHCFPRRQFILLTRDSISFVSKVRPIDELQSLLQLPVDSNEIRRFTETCELKELCAMCIAICVNCVPSQDSFNAASTLRPKALSVFYKYGTDSISFQGLLLYFSRVVRPIWDVDLIKIVISNAHTLYLPDIDEIHFERVEFFLTNLRDFLLDISFTDPPVQKKTPSNHFMTLLNRTLETIFFWRMLLSINISKLLSSLDKETISLLSGLKFSSLATTQEGLNLCTVFATALYSNDDIISHTFPPVEDLPRQCPSLFTIDNTLYFKGFEQLRCARNSPPEDRYIPLRESLEQFLKIPHVIIQSRYTLSDLCNQYKSLYFYYGIIHLSLACAKASDTVGVGLTWFKEGKGDLIENGKNAYRLRLECYTIILNMLNYLNEHHLQEELNDSFKIVRKSSDELFHYTFYEWCVNNNLVDAEFLHLNYPHLKEFLERFSTPKKRAWNLLWKFYVSHDLLNSASEVLLNLADEENEVTPLQERVDYLSRALGLVQVPGDALSHHRLRFLHEKIEMAELQRGILAEAEKLPKEEKVKVTNHLNRGLYSASELCKICFRHGLPESALHLVFSTKETLPITLITKIWTSLIHELVKADPQVDHIAEKVKYLGHKFSASPSVFPLGTLIPILEKLNFTVLKRADPQKRLWVMDTLLDIGIPHDVLFREYSKIIQICDLDKPKNAQKMKHYVDEVIYMMEESWIKKLYLLTTKQSEAEKILLLECLESLSFNLRIRHYPGLKEQLQLLNQLAQMIQDHDS
uniref:Nucleoporin Nup133/Nup155-like N-terminal domain-containing protein n=1 Tax=Arcella intermedia TaxID=1963864 RepID=A0A6B2KWQ8_9EUKA